MSGTIIEVTRHFNVSAERVFDAWLSHESVSQWLFMPQIRDKVMIELNPCEGGSYSIVDLSPSGGNIVHAGQYLELSRPERIRFSLMFVNHSDRACHVTMQTFPVPDGCDVTLSQDCVSPCKAEKVMDGWAATLNRLALALGSI